MSTVSSGVRTSTICAACGAALQSDTRFCQQCGAAVKSETMQPSTARVQAASLKTLASDQIAELQRLVAEHPEDQSYQKLLAVQLHDDAMKDWWKDPNDGSYLCTTFKQIQHARQQLARASGLRFNDPQLRTDIEKLRRLTESMAERTYTGNWLQVVILVFFGIFPGVIWWFVNRRPEFLINRDYVRELKTGKHPGAGARMGGAMEKVQNFFDTVTGGWGGWFALAFMVIFSPIFMILAFKQNYLDVQKEYEPS
jgi:hypothetical protein